MSKQTIRRRDRAFTLVELLVTVAVLMVLVGLLLPAVQAARESARRSQCVNRLKQMMTATQGFETTFGAFPSKSNYYQVSKQPPSITLTSLHVSILPYLGHESLYASFNFNAGLMEGRPFFHQNLTVADTTLREFLCPSDPDTNAQPHGCVNYRLCDGLGEFQRVKVPGSGLMSWNSKDTGAFGTPSFNNSAATIVDGLSNTLAFSEKLVGSGGKRYQPSRDWIEVFRLRESADDWVDTCANLVNHDFARTDAGRVWTLPGAHYTNFYANLPPNSRIPDCGHDTLYGAGLFTARSYHPGGVNAAMVDGSVRWFASTTNVPIWRASGTRDGMEMTSGN